jgi:hypothetical protein
MADIKDIISNIENIYGSNNSLNLLKSFERVIDELDIYVYENWEDGELVSGPKEHRYWVECTFMWPIGKMPNPRAGKILTDYGCKVQVAESTISKVRKIKTPDDIRPGTKKGKIDRKKILMIKISIPKKLIHDIDKGYRNLDKNKVEDILSKDIAKLPSDSAAPAPAAAPAEEVPAA